ncbi:MAG: type II secretion system major pseudopilin GspG [Gammaproteobacteria bacterium]|nr:type II secretion system major pseudopilin GspG [Gammaproteobacteria bacterium]MBT8111536.1 type II secretion system major pseudopilin GspG [Gammaproteobacteria bacterium]NND47067.1 type II secretion system major pseudopilin GspG [Woeseiaceae bacterium]NNL46234.1 type II secretion system major pseudopilin GspG [Woeseiaceae bacterium]
MFDILTFTVIKSQLRGIARFRRYRPGATALSQNPRAQCRVKRQQGFTLIEIMVVVIIIGILAAIVAPNVIGRIDDAQITKAKAEISNIENALKFYRLDNFTYPTTEQGLQSLVTKPTDPNIRNWKTGGYLDRLPKDPWGNPYQYLNPGNNNEIDVYTLGRDGRPGGEGLDADIGNWDPE